VAHVVTYLIFIIFLILSVFITEHNTILFSSCISNDSFKNYSILMKNKSIFDKNFNFIDFYLRHDNPTWLNISISFYVLGKKCFIFLTILNLFKNIIIRFYFV
jgi:hypothetical protein